MLILTWRIYYFHRTQRLPRYFTEGDDFCGMGDKRTTAARGAHTDCSGPRHRLKGVLETWSCLPAALLWVSWYQGRPQTIRPTGSAYGALARG